MYLLHFAEKRYHAQHYLGSTKDLQRRLFEHANGRGAKLTKALWEDGDEWQLAAIFVPLTRGGDVRKLEKRAKSNHNSVLYCPLCSKESVSPPGTQAMPADFFGLIESLTLKGSKWNQSTS